MNARDLQMVSLENEWADNPRWKGIKRDYSATDVIRLRGSLMVEYTLARRGAEKLWDLLNREPYINCLGAVTGGQAMQQVKAGIKAIHLSGWHVVADSNAYLAMYPDQSSYPVDSMPEIVEHINEAFKRADEIQWERELNPGDIGYIDYFVPIVADATTAVDGNVLNAFELMKAMIRAGAAGVHFEDQQTSVKGYGHMNEKVLVPTRDAVQKLVSARLAADICGVPTIIVARTDAQSASLLTSDYDEYDRPFIIGGRTAKGLFQIQGGLAQAVSRGLAYAPYADLIWCETNVPDLDYARRFAEAIHAEFPGKMLAYNCSPTFNWKQHVDDLTIACFQRELGAIGYKYQFVSLAGIHSMWYNMFDLAKDYIERGMTAYVEKVQEPELAACGRGYAFTSQSQLHPQETSADYYDDMTVVIEGRRFKDL